VLEIIDAGKEKIVRVVPHQDSEGQVGEDEEAQAAAKGRKEIQEFAVPFGKAVLVKEGDTIAKGQAITDGVIDVKELFKVAGMAEAQAYIIREVGKIYALQGSAINDKHIEVIVRQMFSRVRIKQQGDSDFSIDELVERDTFLEANDALKADGKEAAKGLRLLMGISKTALSVSSFLSAASFQETTRVLINAAIEGQKDKLRGLKENVIIGRLIPAGTGYRKDIPHAELGSQSAMTESKEVLEEAEVNVE